MQSCVGFSVSNLGLSVCLFVCLFVCFLCPPLCLSTVLSTWFFLTLHARRRSEMKFIPEGEGALSRVPLCAVLWALVGRLKVSYCV